MNNNLLKEIKLRSFLVLLNWFILTNVLYFYKEILLFNLFKKLNYLNDIEFYLVYTNITELFTIYIKLINFCTIQITLIFMLYHIIIFCIPSLYKKEFRFLVSMFIAIIAVNKIYFFTFLSLFCFLVDFLKNFQEPYMYFEIKITEILKFILQTFLHFQIIFTSFVLLAIVKFYKNIALSRKFNYALLILLLINFYFGNLTTKLLIFYCCFIIIFEFLVFFVILKTKV